MTRRSHWPYRGRRRRQEARAIPQLEALEERTLLSAALISGSYDPSQVLVQFRPEALSGGAPSLDVPGASLGQALDPTVGLYDVRLNGRSMPDALALLQADPRVLSAEPDYYVQVAGAPNDPAFASQWGLLNTGQAGGVAGVDVHATQAWKTTSTSPGVVVAMIDTGVDYNHPDLYQNIWINQGEIPNWWYVRSSPGGPYNKVVYKSQIQTATPGVITFADLNNPVNAGLVWDNNNDGRIDPTDLLRPISQGGWESGSTKDGDTQHPDDFFGWNFVNNTNNPYDDNGHGTNVAGVLGAVGNNGVGVAGLDWRVQLQDLKVFNSSGLATISAIVAAIDYSIQHGAKISNNSWSIGSASADLLGAAAAARAAGQIFVTAAGNEGNAAPGYPAMYGTQLDNIVSVAAIDRTGQLWSSSNYGASTVTLAAPGVDVLGDAPRGGVASYTGTSQAVPFVTATLALVWGEHPNWTYKQVISQVTSTVTPLASLQGKTITGGLVNTAAAVGPPPAPAAPAPAPHVLSAVFSGPNASSVNRVVVTFDQVINPFTLTANNVHLTDPSGQAVPLGAMQLSPGSDGHQYEIDFAAETVGGAYSLTIGSGVRDAAGAALTPYAIAYVLNPPIAAYKSPASVPIPDVGMAVSTITVNQDVSIGSLQVTLNISHTYDSDLFIVLQAPDGTQILLVNRVGGSGHNFINTVLSDSATVSIRTGTAPFTGKFLPEQPLSLFDGKDARGVWKLFVWDEAAGDVGVINSWTLTVTPASGGPAGISGEVVRALTNAEAAPAPAVTRAQPMRQAPADIVFQQLGVRPAATHLPDGWRSFLSARRASEDGDWTTGLS
jgi:subtilisin family serine protease